MEETKGVMSIKPRTLQVLLTQEKSLDKKGKEHKDPQGNLMYKRDDFIGLINLLNKFDSRIHAPKDYKMFIKMKDKLFENWKNENKELDMSLDEATFLKSYLSEITTKDSKDIALQEFEIRTLVGILEQLE